MACQACEDIKNCNGYVTDRDQFMRLVLLLLCDISDSLGALVIQGEP